MPDGLNAYRANGQTYLVTANEGDAREWGDYVEPSSRVKRRSPRTATDRSAPTARSPALTATPTSAA